MKSRIKDKKQELDSEIQRIIDKLRTEYTLILANESTLKEEYDNLNKNFYSISPRRIEYEALRRESQNNLELYIEASKRLREVSLTRGLITNNVKIVEKAEPPLYPMPSGKVKTILLGIFMGLSVGAGLALTREKLDKRFKSAVEVETYLNVPFLGVIPYYPLGRHKRRHPIMVHASDSIAADAYRMLRRRIQLSSLEIKTLLVTSTVAGEGKSTSAANIGVAFARVGMRVVIVDADLRRPSLHHSFGLSNEVGLTDVLMQGTDEWKTLLRTTEVENLLLLPAGRMPFNPSDLFSLKSMRTLIEDLKSTYDLVIFDSPMVLNLPDTETLGSEMDGILLVHYPKIGNKDTTFIAKQFLERAGAKIVGVVFNNVTNKELKYYPYHTYYTYASEYIDTVKLINEEERASSIKMQKIRGIEKWVARIDTEA
jgi:capsular exopolysaccharide synthesis family protein